MENPSPFVLQSTADGSPTLSLGERGEWMHHRRSAFEETLYVYGEAVRRVTLRTPTPSFVSVGLGLGYVELLLAATRVREGWTGNRLRTFESDASLRAGLLSWIQTDASLPAPFATAYDTIASRVAAHFDVAPPILKIALRDWRESGLWTLDGALDDQTEWDARYDCILYDAFSADTAPALWEPEFLTSFIERAAAPRCVFATYAATGDLKRVLAKHRFRDEKRVGYAGKRECTLSLRP
jgi:hypothetical protein